MGNQKILNLNEALKLYKILSPYFPLMDYEQDSIDLTDFISGIINNIRNSGNHKDYLNAVLLITDYSIEELKDANGKDVLDLFVQGLIANNVLDLIKFCEVIRLG